jgi:hypothetical protein
MAEQRLNVGRPIGLGVSEYLVGDGELIGPWVVCSQRRGDNQAQKH